MTAFLIISSLAVVVGAVFFLLGRIRPEWRLWDDVDRVYYPLGIIGVVFFFLSSADARDRVSAWSSLHAQREQQERVAAFGVLEKYFALMDLLSRLTDTTATCDDDAGKDQRFAIVCRPKGPVWLINRTLLLFPAHPVLVGFFMPSMEALCQSEALRANDAEAWTRLRTIGQEFDVQTRKKARELTDDLVVACKASLAIRAAKDKELLQALPANNQIPSPGYVFLMQLREWLWPLVLILALSLKVGKTEAGRSKKQAARD